MSRKTLISLNSLKIRTDSNKLEGIAEITMIVKSNTFQPDLKKSILLRSAKILIRISKERKELFHNQRQQFH